MMGAVALECFGPAQSAGPMERSYEDGFTDGFEAGLAAAESAAGQQRADLASALAGLTNSQTQAEERIVTALGPLFEALCSQLLPDLLHSVIGVTLAEELMRRSDAVLGSTRTLHVAPEDLEAVQVALEQIGLDLAVAADPGLAPGQALMGTVDDVSIFDLAEVIGAIRGALAALIGPATGETHDE